MKTTMNDKFRERISRMVDDQKAFFEVIENNMPYAFRVNTLKAERKQVLERFGKYGIACKQLPFCKDGFVTDDLRVGSTMEHFMGHVYIQEVVSMIPPLMIDLGRVILDACAAPGSKTTQLAALMENKGVLIANDIDYNRIKALNSNIERLGVLNTTVMNMNLMRMDGEFDSILLDAPCSAEGTIRKNWDTLSHWSEKLVISNSSRQKLLILKAYDMLKEGGNLVYSTCTFGPEENEEVIDHLLEKRDGVTLEKVSVKGFRTSEGVGEWGKKTYDFDIKKVARIWPHHNNTGGFFVAKVTKG
ncbi:MAG: NOL1/NOP2/sun family putative RNA methylase [Candidatus Aenigmarchaeota archaeon]|nr:NOL1/NOP2/sun family putative RNA methylase [Candidatus Aenigmarchaeota archaeon]